VDSDAPKTPRSKDLPPVPHYRALLVDDDAATREFVSYVFGESYQDRCEIVTCGGLGEAIHLINHQPDRPVDVVLLDLGLSETQGIETYQEFRKHIRDIPVIVFTGNDDPDLRDALMLKGVQAVIPKGSMTPLGLYQAISNAVIHGRYRGSSRVEVIRLPETLLRDAKSAQEELRVHYDSLPPNSTDKLRDKAHMVGLEILSELSREVGGMNAAVAAMRKDLDALREDHDSMRTSVVDLRVDAAKEGGKTLREKLRLFGKVVAVLAAVVAGASWREALQAILGMIK
jgi:DNA-binding NarL/FixJ family response regulator